MGATGGGDLSFMAVTMLMLMELVAKEELLSAKGSSTSRGIGAFRLEAAMGGIVQET